MGHFFSAEEAHEAGAIGRVVGAGKDLETALEIAKNPPLSVQQSACARRILMDALERQVAANADPMRLYLTEDFESSVAAFVNKGK